MLVSFFLLLTAIHTFTHSHKIVANLLKVLHMFAYVGFFSYLCTAELLC